MNDYPMKWFRVYHNGMISRTVGYVQTNTPLNVAAAINTYNNVPLGTFGLVECPDPTIPAEPCCHTSTRSVRRYYEGEGRGSRMRCEVVPLSSIGTIGRELICMFDGYPDRYAIEIVGESYWVGCDETGTIIEFGG